MSRASRRDKLEAQLRSLESDFRTKLVEELRLCAAGKQGMFAQRDRFYDQLDDRTRELMSRAEIDLRSRTVEIEHLRAELGYTEPFGLAARYRAYRDMRGPNAPGEPKPAKLFLEELGLA